MRITSNAKEHLQLLAFVDARLACHDKRCDCVTYKDDFFLINLDAFLALQISLN